MDHLDKKNLVEMFEFVAKIMSEHSEELCRMDAEMGDGDLGLTMKKGFSGLPSFLEEQEDEDLGKALVKAGMKLASYVPSTMGTLMASGLMGGGKAISGADKLDAEALCHFLQGFADGIAKRGKCAPGDRTVLDAVSTASDFAKEALANGGSVSDIAEAAFRGAKQGMEATKEMKPKFGKAAVFAEKGIGRADQGAFAGMLMIQGIRNYICGVCGKDENE